MENIPKENNNNNTKNFQGIRIEKAIESDSLVKNKDKIPKLEPYSQLNLQVDYQNINSNKELLLKNIQKKEPQKQQLNEKTKNLSNRNKKILLNQKYPNTQSSTPNKKKYLPNKNTFSKSPEYTNNKINHQNTINYFPKNFGQNYIDNDNDNEDDLTNITSHSHFNHTISNRITKNIKHPRIKKLEEFEFHDINSISFNNNNNNIPKIIEQLLTRISDLEKKVNNSNNNIKIKKEVSINDNIPQLNKEINIITKNLEKDNKKIVKFTNNPNNLSAEKDNNIKIKNIYEPINFNNNNMAYEPKNPNKTIKNVKIIKLNEKNNLNLTNEQIQNLIKENQEYKKKNQILVNSYQNLKNENKEYLKNINNLTKKINEKIMEINNYKKNIQNLNTQLNNYKNTNNQKLIIDLKNENKNMKTKISELQNIILDNLLLS